MADYSYIAIEKSGKEIKGSMESDSREKVEQKLRSQGCIPLEIKEQNALQKDIKIGVGKKVKTRDLSVFCRQFVSMLRAGVSIVEALDMLSIQTENKTLSQAIREVRTEIGKGSTLSEAMEKQNKVFPPMLVNMVEAGETSGSIDKSLERMAIQFEKEAKLKGMMKRSMMYPMVLGVVALVILIVMLTYVIPNYMEMFEGYDFDMPALTLAIMHMGDFVKNHAILLVAIMAILAGVLAPQFVKYIGRSRISTDIQNAQQIATAISAEFADTARTTAVAEQTITDGKAKWDGDTDAASTARTQKEVFGGVPKVKAASGNFKYSVSADGEVTVKVGDTQLYPEAEGDWAK